MRSIRSVLLRAMVLFQPGFALCPQDLPVPKAAPGQVLVMVSTSAVCRADLHAVDGEWPNPKRPLIPGHEIVGRGVEAGCGVGRFRTGDRVGIPWLGWTCGEGDYCRSERAGKNGSGEISIGGSRRNMDASPERTGSGRGDSGHARLNRWPLHENWMITRPLTAGDPSAVGCVPFEAAARAGSPPTFCPSRPRAERSMTSSWRRG